MALTCILALLASPLCPLNCSGADCRMRQTTSGSGEECHGAAQTGFAQIRSAKIMVCDGPALAVRTDSLAERLWKITRLGAGSSMADAMKLPASASVLAERGLRWQLMRGRDLHAAEGLSILTLRI